MNLCRVKLAVHKETRECVAVKIVHVDDQGEGLTHESLRKEVSTHTHVHTHTHTHSHTHTDLYHEDAEG